MLLRSVASVVGATRTKSVMQKITRKRMRLVLHRGCLAFIMIIREIKEENLAATGGGCPERIAFAPSIYKKQLQEFAK